MRFTKLNYCQYLLSSQINYTITNLADHVEAISHDRINRYLRREKLTPRLLWENVKPLIQVNEKAYVIFDDTVLDKRYAEDIELTRRQYSGNEHRVVRGIGLISCAYVNPETSQFWVIEQGKIIKIKSFPQDKKVKFFRVTVSTNRTEYIATNDLTQDSTDAVQQVCDIRWKIEEFHRELKQLTGVESCQCRKARIQRNHINCAMLVWLRLKQMAYSTGQTVYQLKHGLLSRLPDSTTQTSDTQHDLGINHAGECV